MLRPDAWEPLAVKRREFVTLIAGGALALPFAARAQQFDTMRRIGVMIALPEGDPEPKKWIAAFVRGLEKLGWAEGRNLQIDYRFAPAGARAPELASELLALQPNVVLAFSSPVTVAFQRATPTIPIVFIGIADAIAQGFVDSLARPSGNLTGLTMYEASVSGKYVSMLKEIEPQLTHTTFLANPKTAPYYEYYLRGAKLAGRSLGVEVVFSPIENDATNIKRVIAAFARAVPKGGMVVVGD